MGEIEVDPFADGSNLARAEHRVPGLGVSRPRGELGLGKDFLEVVVADVFYETLVIFVLDRKMKEVGTDEGIVVSDLRVSPLGTEIGIEKHLAIPPAPDFLVHPLVIYVAGDAGKLEVFEKGFAIPFSLLPLEDQEFVHDVCLEGIEGRGKPSGEAKLPV